MSEHADTGRFEKAAAAALFVLMAAVGWLPFFFAAWREPFAIPPFLFLSGGLALLSLAFIYDAAERLIGAGRGIYAAAIACSFTPASAVIADTPLLPITALMFIVASSIWLAVRAEGDNRALMIGVVSMLMLISGYLFSLFVYCLAFLFPVALLVMRDSRLRFTALIPAAVFLLGAFLRTIMDLGLPMIVEIPSPENLPVGRAMLMNLPWLLWLLPMLLGPLVQRKIFALWQPAAAVTIVLLYWAGLTMDVHPFVLGAAAMPVLALGAARASVTWFAAREGKVQWLFNIPVLIVVLAMLMFVIARMSGFPGRFAPAKLQVILCGVLGLLALLTMLRKLPRWTFAVMVLSGLLLGSMWWHRPPLLGEVTAALMESDSMNLLYYWPVVVVAGLVLVRRLYGRGMPRILRKPDKPYQYGTANFRSFENPRRKEWIGEPVAFQSAQDHEYCFAVFSDVTGSEFPMSTRRGGYYVYRALAQELTRDRVSFAVSVGDMATCAGVAAYRRLRQILRHIKVPLAVAPGNHDLFADDEYRPQFFHSLFGPDNCAFQIGPVGFVLLNNAYGWISDEQFAWLEEALKKNGSRFKLVFCHKPPLDPRAHEYYGMEIRECAERMRKLFAEHGVTAVFSGHIHELLTAEEDGVTYIISGGGGSKLDSSEAVHHYLLVDVTEYQLTVRAVPLTVRGDATTKREPLLELTFPIST